VSVYLLTFSVIFFCFVLSNVFRFARDVRIVFGSIAFLYFLIFVGLRHEVGTDWESYLIYYESLGDFSFDEIFSLNPGYQLLQFISKYFGLGIYGVNTLCAAIFLYGFHRAIKTFELNIPISYMVAFPYIIMIVVSGYSRQGVALGLIFAFIECVYTKKLLLSFLFFILAVSFHETAIIGSILYNYIVRGNKKLFLSIIIILFLLIYFVYMLFEARFEHFMNAYIEKRMSSTGAYIRIFLNILAGLFLFLYSKKWKVKFDDYSFWIFFWYVSLFFLIFAITTNATTVADRLILYFYPLQIIVFSRIIQLPSEKSLKFAIFLFVILMYFAVMMIWLLFSVHKDFWLPYGNLLFEVLR